jgi:hypothetical protein
MRDHPCTPRRSVSAAALLFAATGLHAQSVWHVKHDAAGAGTGVSWADALTDLQAALSLAAPGDEIWVAAGTYRPAGPNADRDVSFALRPGVALYAGFSGTEKKRDQRDWAANRTVLSGDLNADDAAEFANTSENSYHVVVAYDVERDAVLDGFIVRGGRADGPGFGAVRQSREQGAGMNVYDASPSVRNCTFERNWVANHGAVNDHGHMSEYTDCVFRENYSQMFGAGLYIHHHTAATVLRCGFFGNHSAFEGAGLYSRSSAGCTVTMCTFTDNRAGFGAGMYNAEGSTNTVTDCSFSDNAAVVGGGGLYSHLASPTVLRCSFFGNAAGLGEVGGGAGGGGSGGAGIWTEGGAATITDCVFTANAASFGAGVYNIHDSAAVITGCTFVANNAAEAGGVYSLASPTTTTRCTFQGNTAVGSVFSVGGAISNYFSDAVVRDCTFERNIAELGGGALYNEGENPVVFNCTFVANESLGSTEGWGGAVLNGYFTDAAIAGCVMVRNRAHLGGAVYNMAFADTSIINCTIVNNLAVALQPGPGGGVSSSHLSNSNVANCILLANAPSQLDGTYAAVRFSCIEGGYKGAGAERVLDVPPGLLRLPSPGPDAAWDTPDDDFGDLRLAPGSRCIDAGDNAPPTGLIDTDAAGRPRFVDDAGVPDSGVGAPPVVDVGAHEFQGRSCLADFNANGAVNSQDLFDFLAAFFAGGRAGDANRDGVVNSQDFFDYLAWFFAGCGG